MTFKAYRAAPFNHTHENHAFDYLHDLLEAHWVEQDEPLRLLGNFYVDGKEIDALVIKRNAIIVIDFIAEIAEGATMSIVDLEGNQAVDTLFFCDRQGFCEWSSASCG